MVLLYLQGIRFGFLGRRDDNSPSNAFSWKLRLSIYESFTRWTAKLGSTVVATYCKTEESLNIIRENCPNLEALTLINFETKSKDRSQDRIIYNFNEDFKCLK